MSLSGDLRETQFADLIQFYGISKQSVAVAVRTSASSPEPDGVFYFDRGDLVGAYYGGVEGREALRRALRLKQGTFTVVQGAAAPDASSREPWNRVVMEEMVNLDEELHAACTGRGPAAGATATGPAVTAHPAVLASALGPVSAAPKPPERPPAAPPSGSGAPPAAGGKGSKPRRPGTGILLLAAGSVVVIALAAFALFRSARSTGPAADAVAATSGRRGILSGEIVLGMASPFTGANRELGRGMKTGIETAFGLVNEAGGVHGRKLRLVALDDGYEPERTATVMKDLVEKEKVFAVVGNVGTPTAAVSVPYCTEQKVVFFGAFSGGDLLRKTPPDRYVFNYRPSYAEETAAAVQYLVEVRRIEPGRIAIFAQEDEFGASGARGAIRQLANYGVEAGKIVRVGYKRNTADVSAAYDTVEEASADLDAVVMVATYKAAATFIRKTRDADLGFVYTNVSAVDSDALSAELVSAGKRYAEDVVVTQVVPLPTSQATAVKRYRDALAKYGGGDNPGFLTLEGFVVGNLLASALERAGADLDTEKLVTALEGMSSVDLGIGARVAFGPREHQGSHKVWGTMLQRDGTYRAIDLE